MGVPGGMVTEHIIVSPSTFGKKVNLMICPNHSPEHIIIITSPIDRVMYRYLTHMVRILLYGP